MTVVFLVENEEDVITVKSLIAAQDIKHYRLFPVSPDDPFFLDTFHNESLESWSNLEDFQHIRFYDWIIRFKENAAIINNVVDHSKLPYSNSLEFYLAMRFGRDYRIFSDFLTKFAQEKGVTDIFVKSFSLPYVNYLREIRPFGSVRVQTYAR